MHPCRSSRRWSHCDRASSRLLVCTTRDKAASVRRTAAQPVDDQGPAVLPYPDVVMIMLHDEKWGGQRGTRRVARVSRGLPHHGLLGPQASSHDHPGTMMLDSIDTSGPREK